MSTWTILFLISYAVFWPAVGALVALVEASRIDPECCNQKTRGG